MPASVRELPAPARQTTVSRWAKRAVRGVSALTFVHESPRDHLHIGVGACIRGVELRLSRCNCTRYRMRNRRCRWRGRRCPQVRPRNQGDLWCSVRTASRAPRALPMCIARARRARRPVRPAASNALPLGRPPKRECCRVLSRGSNKGRRLGDGRPRGQGEARCLAIGQPLLLNGCHGRAGSNMLLMNRGHLLLCGLCPRLSSSLCDFQGMPHRRRAQRR